MENTAQTFYRGLAWKLINLRQAQGLTQTDLGEKVGLSKFQISRMERGFGDTTLENIRKVATYFEMPLAELLSETEIFPLSFKLRQSHLEKGGSSQILKFAKVFPETATMRLIQLEKKSLRRVKIEKGKMQDLFCLRGKIKVQSPYDFEELKEWQFLSIRGEGLVRLLNLQTTPVTLLIITY